MAQKDQRNPGTRLQTTSRSKKVGHWARVGVMFLSGGFIFPHAMTENGDAGNDAKGTPGKTTR
jgi:hypothetical protein